MEDDLVKKLNEKVISKISKEVIKEYPIFKGVKPLVYKDDMEKVYEEKLNFLREKLGELTKKEEEFFLNLFKKTGQSYTIAYKNSKIGELPKTLQITFNEKGEISLKKEGLK